MIVSRIVGYFRSVCRLRSLQASDAEERAQERHRRAALSGIAALSARVVGIGTWIVTVPITLSYLGPERFGIWMAISSVLAIMNFADLGIGNGLMNAVAEAHGRNDVAAMKRTISSGFAVLLSIALLLLGCFALAYWHVDWAQVFNAHSEMARSESGPALLVFAACFALGIPASVVQKVQLGLQEGFRSYLWLLAGNIAGLAGVLCAVRFRAGLPWLFVAMAGSPVAVAAVNGLWFFGAARRDLLPSARLVSLSIIRQLSRLGFAFLILQLVSVISLSSDSFIIARVIGPEAATQFAVPQRMFQAISQLSAMFLAPLWPAYAEAITRGDGDWVRATLFRSLKLTAAAVGVCATVLVCAGHQIIRLWIGPGLRVSVVLLLGLALWTLLETAGNAIVMLLNGARVIKFQLIIAATFGTLCLAGKVVAARNFGTTAMPWATAVAYVACVAAPTIVRLPSLLRGIRTRCLKTSTTSALKTMEYA